MTAEKLLKENGINFPDWSDENDVINTMIEFAKYHVKEALEEGDIKIKSDSLENFGAEKPDCWDSDSILNAYPLHKIV